MTINKRLILIYFLVFHVLLALPRTVGIEPLDTPPTRVNFDLGPCKVVIRIFTPSDDFSITRTSTGETPYSLVFGTEAVLPIEHRLISFKVQH